MILYNYEFNYYLHIAYKRIGKILFYNSGYSFCFHFRHLRTSMYCFDAKTEY